MLNSHQEVVWTSPKLRIPSSRGSGKLGTPNSLHPWKMNGWNLRIRAPWKRRNILKKPSFSGSMLILGGCNGTPKNGFKMGNWSCNTYTFCCNPTYIWWGTTLYGVFSLNMSLHTVDGSNIHQLRGSTLSNCL